MANWIKLEFKIVHTMYVLIFNYLGLCILFVFYVFFESPPEDGMISHRNMLGVL
jgi:hypothetical protein